MNKNSMVGKRICIYGIDGLGYFSKMIHGRISVQNDNNSAKVILDEVLKYGSNSAKELNIRTRHKGEELLDITPDILSKLFRIKRSVAVNAWNDEGKISFIGSLRLS
jgi:hypothetical protein